jgi:hypothetical protein
MKKYLISVACALLFGFATSCDKNTETTPDPLASPASLVTSDITDAAATLTWAAVENAGSYNVRINGGETIPVVETSYRVEGLAPNAHHTWAVQAVRGNVTSPWSYDKPFDTAEPNPIEAPTGLAVSDIGLRQAILHWDAVDEATGYKVRYGDKIVTVGRNNRTFDVFNLDVNTTYNWGVCTLTDDGESFWAEGAPFDTFALEAPANLTTIETSYISATVGWDAVEMEGITSYEVRLGDVGPFVVDKSETTYVFDNLDVGTAYTWSVRTVSTDTANFTYDDVGEWAEFSNFSTDQIRQVELKEVVDFDYREAGNFRFDLRDFSGNGSGYELTINLTASGTNDASTVPFVKIPAATYPLTAGVASLKSIVNGAVAETYTVTGGNATISGDDDGYRMRFIVELADEDPIYLEWNGYARHKNPNFTIPSNAVDMGRLRLVDDNIDAYEGFGYVYYEEGYLRRGVCDIFLAHGHQDGVAVGWNQFGQIELAGTGWYIGTLQFHKESGAGPVLASGTYHIAQSNRPGDVQSGHYDVMGDFLSGAWVRRLDNGVSTDIAVESGMIYSEYLGEGMYNFEVYAYDKDGKMYTCTIYNTDPVVPTFLSLP